MDITKAAATAVRELMVEHDPQVSELALSEATGIPRTTLKRSLAGVRPLNVDELDAIARTLGTTPEAIVTRARGVAA
jgi:DNA-binding Xre family transcriptional regulator